MKKRIRAGIAAMALCVATHAAGQADAAAAIVARLKPTVDSLFALDDETRALLDAPLRAAVEDLRRKQLDRATAALKTWADEALAQVGAEVHRAGPRVWYRLINETAIWRTQIASPAHEAALQAIWGSALPCWDAFEGSAFAQVVRQLRHAPPSRRAAALDGERELLARWGQPHDGLEQPPLPRLHGAQRERLALVRATGTPPQPPLPPVVAATVIDKAQEPSRATRCAMLQWWLQVQNASGGADAPRRALSALRYANAPLARAWMSQTDLQAVSKQETESGYPGLARRFGVEGITRMRVELDSQTQLRRAELAERVGITVPGIPRGQAVAFMDLLDEAAASRLSKLPFPAVRPEELKDGVAVRTVDLVWTLQ